ncbi:ketoacyl-synt-domain-containing protein, partial [Metarhizium majus ARSEF 297]
MRNNQSNRDQNNGLQNICKRDQPIAIVGMACRLPGDSSSTEKLWQLLSTGGSGHCQVPQSRYNASAFYHPDRDHPGTINSTTGYFINEDIRNFENSFFGISNIEAIAMDPQQGKLLEVVFECFETAGVTLEAVNGANVGCYVGNFALDYPLMQFPDMEHINRYTASGATPTLLANRISRVFNLRGPSFVLDTGCSSSLYALHCACSALDLRECESALVGSSNLIQMPQLQVSANKTGIISDSAICRTFDAQADGYGRSDGVGALYLKRLSDALRDQDPIRAVIRGTAINSNGRTPGIMQPSADGQEGVIRQACARAGLSPADTDYVEAHGTGTAVGDPIEVEAISRVFINDRDRPISIGSVKTNLGHSEATSGITSVIKVVLAMEKGAIPPTINLETINPKISCFNVNIVRDLMPWPETSCRRASVNSFGFGGANSHAIIEALSTSSHKPNIENGEFHNQSKRHETLIPVSAHSAYSFERRVEDLKTFLVTAKQSDLGAIAYTMSNGRTHLQNRGYLLVDHPDDAGHLHVRYTFGPALTTATRPITYVCTGQGAQWLGMGRSLFLQNKVFKDSIRAQDAYLAPYRTSDTFTLASLFSTCPPNSIDVNSPDVSQVLCTAMQIAIIDVLRSWSVKPSFIVGHSSGEIAAAYGAGYLSSREAILIAHVRGAVIAGDELRSPGAMLSVGISRDQALLHLEELQLTGRMELACVNSPYNVTMSGDKDAVEHFRVKMNDLEIFNRPLKTNSIAYHSHHMRGPIGDRYEALVAQVLAANIPPPDAGSVVRMLSTATGHALTLDEARSPKYWRRNLEHMVLFNHVLGSLFAAENPFVIEIGPHPALQVPIREILASVYTLPAQLDGTYAYTVSRNLNESQNLLRLAGTLFCRGYGLDFDAVNQFQASERHIIASLPSYPWDYQDVVPWKEPRENMETRNRLYGRHELLGLKVHGGSNVTLVWRNVLSVNDVPWLADHRIGPTILFPGAGFISMIIEAACQANLKTPSDKPYISLRQVKFVKALPLPENGEPIEIFTELRRLPISGTSDSKDWWYLNIISLRDGQHEMHVSGRVACYNHDKLSANRQIILDEAAMANLSPRTWYRRLNESGFNGGDSFKVLEEVFSDRNKKKKEAHSKVWLFPDKSNCTATHQQEYFIHPTVIDGIMQTCFISAAAGRADKVQCLIPIEVEELDLISSSVVDFQSDEMWSIKSRAVKIGFGGIIADAELHNPDGKVLVRLNNARASVYQGVQSIKPTGVRVASLRVAWKPDIAFLDSEHSDVISTYLSRTQSDLTCIEPHNIISACLDLVVHKRPDEKIAFLNVSKQTVDEYMAVLGSDEGYRRFAAIGHGHLTKDGGILGVESQIQDSGSDTPNLAWTEYDVVVANIEDAAEFQPLFASVSQDTDLVLSFPLDTMPIKMLWGRLQVLTTTASHILWVTHGNILIGGRPEATLAWGAARAIRMEEPSLRLATFDFGESSDLALTARNIFTAFQQVVSQNFPDLEYVERMGIVHVNRWVPDAPLNLAFLKRQQKDTSSTLFGSCGPIQLDIEDEVEVEAKCYGDVYILNNKFDSMDQYCSHEFSGVVRRVGPQTKHLNVGDRVVVVSPGRFCNIDVVPESDCSIMLPTEDFESMCTLPIIFMTASPSTLARTCEKQEWLSQTFGIPKTHIFNSRDASFLPLVLNATDQRGVDVVLNSLSGDLLHASVAACAPLGRFIEIGRKDILDHGRLEMSSLRRSVSFHIFDLLDLRSSNGWCRETWRSLQRETMGLFREGVLQPVEPRHVFDVSDITTAFRFFSRPSRTGKVVVSMQNPYSEIQLLPRRYISSFDEKKTYLMVGCFGGIGTSITRWMLGQGARKFVFLSRSGKTKPSAAMLVIDLESAGCQVEVISGDVMVHADVMRAVENVVGEIGGVVHASMSVRATHWSSLTCEDWHYGIGAKVSGTRNIHEALSGRHETSLDFFLLISSISGTIGSATEPSYCAANAYMDSFARFRRSQGLKATSIALGVITEVGYLHENPQMEAVYRHRGLQSSNEDEMLQLIDLAIAHPDGDKTPTYDEFMRAHLLTGLEMDLAKSQAGDSSSTAFNFLFQDPRAGLLKASYNRDVKETGDAASLYKSLLPQQIREAVLSGDSLESALTQALTAKLGNIIMLSPDQIDRDQPLMSFRLDSMVAAEFRNFVFQTMRVDIPFMTLLSKATTMGIIASFVVEQIQHSTIDIEILGGT